MAALPGMPAPTGSLNGNDAMARQMRRLEMDNLNLKATAGKLEHQVRDLLAEKQKLEALVRSLQAKTPSGSSPASSPVAAVTEVGEFLVEEFDYVDGLGVRAGAVVQPPGAGQFSTLRQPKKNTAKRKMPSSSPRPKRGRLEPPAERPEPPVFRDDGDLEDDVESDDARDEDYVASGGESDRDTDATEDGGDSPRPSLDVLFGTNRRFRRVDSPKVAAGVGGGSAAGPVSQPLAPARTAVPLLAAALRAASQAPSRPAPKPAAKKAAARKSASKPLPKKQAPPRPKEPVQPPPQKPAAKKSTPKPVAKKSAGYPVVEDRAPPRPKEPVQPPPQKPATKKSTSKPVAKKSAANPVAKKTAAKKPVLEARPKPASGKPPSAPPPAPKPKPAAAKKSAGGRMAKKRTPPRKPALRPMKMPAARKFASVGTGQRQPPPSVQVESSEEEFGFESDSDAPSESERESDSDSGGEGFYLTPGPMEPGSEAWVKKCHAAVGKALGGSSDMCSHCHLTGHRKPSCPWVQFSEAGAQEEAAAAFDAALKKCEDRDNEFFPGGFDF